MALYLVLRLLNGLVLLVGFNLVLSLLLDLVLGLVLRDHLLRDSKQHRVSDRKPTQTHALSVSRGERTSSSAAASTSVCMSATSAPTCSMAATSWPMTASSALLAAAQTKRNGRKP